MLENRVYAIIVTYNGMKWLEGCIRSIRSSSVKINMIFIDNSSTDSTVEFLKSNINDDLILIESKTNLGFGKANNLGIREALKFNPDYILLINQDVYISQDTISKLLNHDDKKSILTSIHLNNDGKIDENFYIYSLHKQSSFKEEIILANFVNAAFWVIPINIINDLGGFNPLFNHYSEDNNYAHRLLFHNYIFKIITNDTIVHDRKKYGNKQIFDKNVYGRKLLLIALNIQINGFFTCLSLLREFIKMLIYLFIFNFKKIDSYYIGFKFLIKHLNFIIYSRKEEKKKKLNWIE